MKQNILGIKIAAKMDNQVSEASNLKCEMYNYSVFLNSSIVPITNHS